MFWGGVVYYTMELPQQFEPIIENEVPRLEEKDTKESYLYSIMMVSCTLSFFHLILFIMLAVSLLMDMCYTCGGQRHILEEFRFRPEILWKIIDMGFFGVLSASHEMDQAYEAGRWEQRDNMSDIEKRMACEKLSPKEFSVVRKETLR